MDFVSPVIDILTRLWDSIAHHCKYVRHLGDQLESLRQEMGDLEITGDSVLRTIQREEINPCIIRTKEVSNWLDRVEQVMSEVDEILRRGDQEIQNRCFGNFCPGNCWSSYKLGKEISMKIPIVRELRRLRLGPLTERLPLPPAVEMRMEETIGMDSKLSEVWRSVEDPDVGIIGLYGMGGVGKTTLLKKLNNKFINESLDFYAVIWVTVSKEVSLQDIKDAIANKLHILNRHNTLHEIQGILSTKRCVLLLDDLWGRLDLLEVGFPSPSNLKGSKIIFTTRSEEVCNSMGAQRRYKVESLSPEAALELFRHKVTEDVLNSDRDIPRLAEIVARECKGLPLALVTIGRAMASRRKPEEWRHAVNMLTNQPSKFSGMETSIFRTLRFSYDSLSDDSLKNCFLYCSLFPEDHEIRKDELIELWIAEGFLNHCGTLDDSRNAGEYAIGSLKLACLLESVGDSEDFVKMHDMLREMALWIASENNNAIFVCENDELFRSHGIPRLKETVRISLWSHSIKFLDEIIPSCPHLLTFIARNTHLCKLPKEFFQSKNFLRVLDFRGNSYLRKLPVEVSELINLQYLNLSGSTIEKLPIEVKNLKKLRILLLDGTSSLRSVPGVISSLLSLQVFSRLSTPFNKLTFEPVWDAPLLEELESLAQIREISVALFTLNSVRIFKSSTKLQNCAKRLIVQCRGLLSLDISPPTTSRPSYFQNLLDLCIENCSVKDLTCLIHAPRLRFVFVDKCPFLEEVIACDFASSSEIIEIEEDPNIFQHLKQLNFRDLPCLKSICRRDLPFPSLERIYVRDCPKLRKLPLETSTAASIMGDQEWWDQLEWEDEATKDFFSSKFSSSGCRGPSYTYEATKFDLGDVNKAAELMMRAFEESVHESDTQRSGFRTRWKAMKKLRK